MYNTNTLRKDITLDSILDKVTEYEIYKSYIGDFKVGGVIQCPWRDDKHPSFGIYYSKATDKLRYKDFATGESGGIIQFTEKMSHISNYNQILIELCERLGITNKTKPSNQWKVETKALKQGHSIHENAETIIGVVRQPFTKVDAKFWKQYAIKSATLKKYSVDSIKYCLVNDRVRFKYYDVQPMYSYNVNGRFKIYRPYADKKVKWINNLTCDDVQGYMQLPKTGDVLIITKSMKDVMVLHEMKVSAVSVSSESSFLKDDLIAELKIRFQKIYLLFDNDKCGNENSLKFSEKYNITRIVVPDELGGKDISDATKLNGFDNVSAWLQQQIRK
jgi:hypothetical protein